MRSTWFAVCVLLGAISLMVPRVSAQQSDPIEGIWLDSGTWEWEFRKSGSGYTVKDLTNKDPKNHASATFDGTTVTIEFVDNGYEGTIKFQPSTQKGIRVF